MSADRIRSNSSGKRGEREGLGTKVPARVFHAACESKSMPPPRPFVKWAGGKSQVLAELLTRVPAKFSTYYEPFVGGGALFFALLPRNAVLNDRNEELINAYRVIQTSLDSLAESLKDQPNSKEHYYRVRGSDPSAMNRVERALRFIYLNKTCYNGLWRVNKSGKFNVPFGRYKNPLICDHDNLKAVSQALSGATLLCNDFEAAVDSARKGDFVYFDPPYHPVSNTAYFTNYVDGGFGAEEQERLAGVFRRLAQRGVFAMLSNSDTEYVRSLYCGFRIEQIWAKRAINCRADRRGPVTEVVIRNY